MNSTAQVVPAVVAVDAHHIHGSFGDVGRVVVLAAYQCDRPVLRVAGVRQLIQRTKVVIRLLWTFPVTMMAVYSWGRLPGMDVHVLEPIGQDQNAGPAGTTTPAWKDNLS